MPNEKPILFSKPMVQAILAGRKTMTRRVIKLPKWMEWDENQRIMMRCEGSAYVDQDPVHLFEQGYLRCPYGKPGDILWVRETWNCLQTGNGKAVPFHTEYWFMADDTSDNPDDKWRPSIFMPKEAARIFLRVLAVRPERVQEITIFDIASEGVDIGVECRQCIENYGTPECKTDPDPYANSEFDNSGGECGLLDEVRGEFSDLWNSINADRGHGWDKNDWVWAITFERCEKPAGWPGRD